MTNKYMKRYSISLVTREMKIKTTIKYHFIHTRMAIIFLKKKKRKESQVLVRMWRNCNPHILLVGM